MVEFRPLSAKDSIKVREWWLERWGGETMIVHGEVFQPDSLDGFVAQEDDRWVGLITYRIHQDECEILSLDSLKPQRGTGTRLIQAVIQKAHEAACRRVYLSTTNDNLDALKFSQKIGFALVTIRRNAVDEASKIKPGIPLIGENGIPLRDEIELEFLL